MLKRKYAIKSGYQARRNLRPDGQKDASGRAAAVYDLANFLVGRGGFEYVIDLGAGSGEQLKRLKNVNIIAVESEAENVSSLKKRFPDAQVVCHDLEGGLPPIDEAILKRAVVISADVIESIVEPHKLLQGLSRAAKLAPFVLVTSLERTRTRGPDDFGPPENPFNVREWTIDELYSLFRNYGMACIVGFTADGDKDNFKGTSLAIAGTQALPQHELGRLDTVLAVVTAYNEEDIIGQTIKHLLRQGIDVHVIDNWSTDNTLKIVKKLAKECHNVTFEQFPTIKPAKHTYEWKKILTRIEEVAEASSHDWVMHNDADEIRVSPWRKFTLQQAFTFAGKLGYNLVDFTVADFRPVKDGYDGKEMPDEFFHNFEFTKLSGYFVQLRAWKNNGRVGLAASGGHVAVFDGQKIFPIKFINKHYPLRSVKQGQAKIGARKSQFSKSERKIGWHVQYDNYTEADLFLWDEASLNKYTPEYFYTEFMVELISSIGIMPEED